MVKRLAFAVPGDLATPTGGYIYDRRMIAELGKLGWQVDIVGLGDGFPKPSVAQKAFAREKLLAVPDKCPVVVDGLALGVLPEAAEALRPKAPLVALVHHPLAYETGVTLEQAQGLWESEKTALAAAAGVVCTSASTARLLQEDYEVLPELITTAPPGTDRAEPAKGSSDGILRMISVGAIVPRKGFDVLVSALAQLPELPWRLTIVGDRSRDPPTAAGSTRTSQRSPGRSHHGARCGAGRALAELYAGADLCVLASLRRLRHGLRGGDRKPAGIGTTGGAISDTVPPDAGVLVEPGDVRALARALELLIRNPKERNWLAAGARQAAKTLPTWEDSARAFAAAVEAVA